ISGGVNGILTGGGGSITISGRTLSISGGATGIGITAGRDVEISGTTGAISGGLGGINANMGDVKISGTTGQITGGDFGINAFGGVAISGEVGVISSGNFGVYFVNGPFNISDNSVVYVSSIETWDGDFIPALPDAGSQGILFIGNEGTVYGNVTLKDDLTIEDDQTLLVPSGASLIIPDGKTLTNNGGIDNKGRIDSHDNGFKGEAPQGKPIEYPIFFFPQPTPPEPEPLQAVNTFEHGTITLSDDVLAMLEELGGEVRVVLELVELDGLLAAVTRGYELVVNIAVFVDDEKVDVPLTVSLPYTLKDGENPAAVRVWYMDDDGNLTDLNGVFDDGAITFTITHQSYFVVGYDLVAIWENIFTDLDPDEWYYYAIAFMNHYGLYNGYNNGLVGPEDVLTRSQFATLIWALEGKPPVGDAVPSVPQDEPYGFNDVAEDAWYYTAVTWAAENGIVAGTGMGRFEPDSPISRQEVIQMLYNYAVNFKEYELPQNREMPAFTDEEQIDAWAETATKALAEAGVLSGLPGGDDAFKPQSDATRAEAGQMFMNFVRFVAGE
ncbi:MAG: S-layer homology domain-containing protein, partial [Oscillospiraceae bacterium]|nr:S-layer homology domain-containing protein [Oscillospiraceae bacterium]